MNGASADDEPAPAKSPCRPWHRPAGPAVSVTAWMAVAVFATVYVLIATEKVHRVTAALGGAVVMLLIGATSPEHAFFSDVAGIDWNVIFLLLGMMLIVSVLKRTGLFEFVAIWAAKRSRGRPYRLMVLLILATAFLSAWLDNVTTVLLLAPVTIAVCTRLGVPVVPYLIAEVMACNIGGAATLIGDPPNIMIGSRAGLSFNDFLLHMAPIAALLVVVFAVMARWMFRSAFSYDPKRAAHVMAMRERDAITDGRLLAVSGIVVVIVMACFVLHTTLHLEPSVVAISGGLILLAVSRLGARQVVADVEWETLAFFAGLFVMVGAMVQTGILTDLGQAAARALDGNLFGASMALLFVDRAVRGDRQHPLRRLDQPGRLRDRHRLRRNGAGPGAVVVLRSRRGPRRQRHDHRLLRQRRHGRYRRPRRTPHLLLAVQPLRPRCHRGHDGTGRGVRVGALLRSRLTDGKEERTMTDSDDERIAELEAVLWHDDPRFARALGKGRPRRPREYRNGRARLIMACALAVMVAGAAARLGTLLAVGLILAAIAAHLFDTSRRRGPRRPGP